MSAPSSPTTSVDLSRLPAPTVVEQLDYETIRGEVIAELVEQLPTFDATVVSDPAVKVLEVFAYRELLIRQRFNDRARKVMVAYATEGDLDQLAVNFGVRRLLIDAGDPAQGIDPVFESDESLRERIVLAPESYSVAGPESAYIFHARSADPTIRDASAYSPEPSVVLVSLLSAIGNGAASADQIAAVEDVLGVVVGNRVRPLTDEVIVASAYIVDYTIEAHLVLHSGPDPALVQAEAQRRLDAWLALAGKLGVDAVRAGIIAALYVEGVQNVTLLAPAADVLVNKTQSAHCAGVNVMVSGVDA